MLASNAGVFFLGGGGGELVFGGGNSFLRDEIRAPLKTHAWEATVMQAISVSLKPDRDQNLTNKLGSTLPQTILY